eukprot:1738844-Rhodomonas_salina.2
MGGAMWVALLATMVKAPTTAAPTCTLSNRQNACHPMMIVVGETTAASVATTVGQHHSSSTSSFKDGHDHHHHRLIINNTIFTNIVVVVIIISELQRPGLLVPASAQATPSSSFQELQHEPLAADSVSYTHLTLPTICSV